MASRTSASAAPNAKRTRLDSNPVHEFFSFNETLNESKCLISPPCRKQTVLGRHSGNLEKHLQVHHKEVHEKVKKLKEEKGRNASTTPKKTRCDTLNGVHLSAPQLLRCCMRMISAHGRPFALLDDDAFQGIVQPIVDALPQRERFSVSAKSVARQIPNLTESVRNAISEEVKGRLICLKVDGVTKMSRHFFGINIQYVENAQVVIRTLALKEMFGRHTALNLKSEILSTLDLYGIPVQNILASTSDTGANVVKMSALLREAQDDDVDAEEWFPDFQLDHKLQTVKCAAHTLQLAVNDAISKTPDTAAILSKARGVACALRSPNQSKRLRKEGYAIPSLDVVTRWGSTYDMAESVLKTRGFVKENDSEDTRLQITEEEWGRLEEVVQSLKPARETTRVLQGSQLLLGDFYAAWMKCKYRTTAVESDLARELVKMMEEREKARINKKGEVTLPPLFSYPGFKAAILLDPRFFSTSSAQDEEEAKTYLETLWKAIQRAKRGAKEDSEIEDVEGELDRTVGPSDSSSSDSDDGDDFEKFLKARNAARQCSQASSESKIGPLVGDYLKTTESLPLKTNILEYWETQRFSRPELYELAKCLLAIPATQVSVERLFSSLSYILNPLRHNLSDARLDDLLVLHANDDLVKKISIKCQESPHDERAHSPSFTLTDLNCSTSSTSS